MNEKLEKQLSEKYPILYRYTTEETDPLVPMIFGFECGDGWYNIIDKLSEQIEEFNRKEMHESLFRLFRKKLKWIQRLSEKVSWLRWIGVKKKYPVTAFQVKQKYGGLRFYIGGAPGYINDLVDKAADESFETCEYCGSKKNTETRPNDGHYWVKTLCDDCRKKEELK